jgi:hypothetical protein
VVPLIGYVDRFSARPGETVAVKVSTKLGDPYRAELVRNNHDGDRRAAADICPRRHRVFRDNSGRSGFLGWLDHVLRQPFAQRLPNKISRMLENVLRRFLTK